MFGRRMAWGWDMVRDRRVLGTDGMDLDLHMRCGICTHGMIVSQIGFGLVDALSHVLMTGWNWGGAQNRAPFTYISTVVELITLSL